MCKLLLFYTHSLHSVKVGQGLFPRRSWVAACYGKKIGGVKGVDAGINSGLHCHYGKGEEIKIPK